MSISPNYSISKSDMSTCGGCGGNLHMLTPTLAKAEAGFFPSFFICFACGTVAEIGVGRVVEETDSEQPRPSLTLVAETSERKAENDKDDK